MIDGIHISTTTTIDYYTLGMALGRKTSHEQAAFLDGFAASLHGLGSVDAYQQIQYITEGAHGYAAWLVEELHARFSEPVES